MSFECLSESSATDPHAGATKGAAEHLAGAPGETPGAGMGVDTGVPDEQLALAQGSTVSKLQEARAIRANPPPHLARALEHSAKLEAELAKARAEEEKQVQVHAEHESLVVAVERAMKAVETLQERLAGFELALSDKASVASRVELMLRDDVYAISNVSNTYAFLSSIDRQVADIRLALPAFEKRIADAKAELAGFERKHGIRQ